MVYWVEGMEIPECNEAWDNTVQFTCLVNCYLSLNGVLSILVSLECISFGHADKQIWVILDS